MRGSVPFSLILAGMACQPATTRPPFTPLPEAPAQELRLPVREATRRLAEALRTDTIPIGKIELRDGYMESAWFDGASGKLTSRRPVGAGVVRVRAWVDPARPGSSLLTVETSYRPALDPSLPSRELEREVARDHPAAKRVERALARLVQRYGAPPPPAAAEPALPDGGEIE